MIVYTNLIPKFIVSHDDDDNVDDDNDNDDGIFFPCEDFGINFDYSFPACAFLFFFLFFFELEISSRTLIPIFRSESLHSGSASWDDCGRVLPDKLIVSSFPDGFPHYAYRAA